MGQPLDEQHRLKLDRVARCWREAGLGAVPWAARAMVATASEGYRDRVRLRVDEEGQIVTFNPRKAGDCVVLTETLHEAIDSLRRAWPSLGTAAGAVQHLEVRAGDDEPAVVLTLLDDAPDDLAHRVVARLDEAPLRVVTHRQPTVPSQRSWVTEDVWVDTPVDAFRQVHAGTNRALVAAVCEGARRRGASTFVDLFCGSGNFTLPLLSGGLRGWAVERHGGAVDALVAAATAQGWRERLTAWTGDARRSAEDLRTAGVAADVVVINGPRAGLREGHAVVADLAGDTLALVACRPDAASRDVAAFAAFDLQPTEVQCFDMFPHTDHVETLVWLQRR